MLHAFYINRVKFAGTKTENDIYSGTEGVDYYECCWKTIRRWKHSCTCSSNMKEFRFTSCSFRWFYCGWKYCSLIYCERKILLNDCWFCWFSHDHVSVFWPTHTVHAWTAAPCSSARCQIRSSFSWLLTTVLIWRNKYGLLLCIYHCVS
jgi:hypothetical protein